VKVLLDTDIGSDIDDAICLAYLLAQPRCELLGITTVSGEAEQRAMIASALCRAADRDDVPIFPGASECLLVPQKQPLAPQAAALAGWSHRTDFPRGEAVEFLAHTIRRHPGEVALLAIGPMTNVALLFAEHPDTVALLKQLVLMCGVFTQRGVERRPDAKGLEWNARVDPHATAMVYRAPVAIHRSIGLDVTLQVRMDAPPVRQRFAAGRLASVLDFAEVWFQKRDHIVFHDPLAATTLFDEQICGFERGTVAVEYAEAARLGATDWRPTAEGPHEIALAVDPQRFFDHFFGVVQ
jgi:inosine-uridine nucleoside N-ribohydrolase